MLSRYARCGVTNRDDKLLTSTAHSLLHNPFFFQACGVGSSIETAPCCDEYFAASPGWDAVTGLGSPNFNIIANLVLNNNTAFPAAGAYPLGAKPSTVVYNEDGGDDDEEDKVVRNTALAIAVAAFVLAVVALIVGVQLCRKKPLASS